MKQVDPILTNPRRANVVGNDGTVLIESTNSELLPAALYCMPGYAAKFVSLTKSIRTESRERSPT